MSEVRGIGATEFPSKRDPWLVAVIWSAAIVSLGAGLAVHATSMSATGRSAVLLTCAASGGFGLWVLYGTRYVFDGPLLRIRQRLHGTVELGDRVVPRSSRVGVSVLASHVRVHRGGPLQIDSFQLRRVDVVAARQPQHREWIEYLHPSTVRKFARPV